MSSISKEQVRLKTPNHAKTDCKKLKLLVHSTKNYLQYVKVFTSKVNKDRYSERTDIRRGTHNVSVACYSKVCLSSLKGVETGFSTGGRLLK